MTDGLRLGDHCEKIGSGATPRGGKESYLDAGPYSLIRSQNIHNDAFYFDGLAYISEEQARRLDGVSVQAGDVLINITGDSVARACQVHPMALPARVNQHVAIIRSRPNEIDATFLRYWLVAPSTQAHLLALASAGATRNALTKSMLEGLMLPPVGIDAQRLIASILSALDDKIELNRRMNETLEQMAQAIFKDWFVDFGPTRAKGDGLEPYLAPERWALFPNSFDDKTGLPTGWAEVFLSYLGVVITGKTPSTRKPEYFGKDVPFLKIPDMHGKIYVLRTSSALSCDGARSQASKTLPAGSISVSCIATPGLVVLNHREIQTNQQINSIIPSIPELSLFAFWSCRQLAADVMLGGSGGSVFHNMNKTSFENLKLVFPGELVARLFAQTVAPLHDRILINEHESETLCQTRDYLLPKLMSGEVRVEYE